MTVVLLDERWPTQIPMEAFALLMKPVSFTDEVPVQVRWDLGDLTNRTDPSGNGTLVSTNPRDAQVVARLEQGQQLCAAASMEDPLYTAVKVMHRACSVGEWEMGQTHRSLLPYLEEESQEFAEAVTAGAADEDIRAELADVFLQVLFHAEIASRRGAFNLDEVAKSFVDKMRARAPYLFDGTTAVVPLELQEELWAKGKREQQR